MPILGLWYIESKYQYTPAGCASWCVRGVVQELEESSIELQILKVITVVAVCLCPLIDIGVQQVSICTFISTDSVNTQHS